MQNVIATSTEQAESAGYRNNRKLLKRLTRLQHERAELHWTNVGAFQRLETYQVFLKTMLDIHCRFGAPAASLISMDDAVLESDRASALCADLKLTNTLKKSLPSLQMNRDFAWGVLYVLNGSAMGASMLLNSKAIDTSWPTAYLETMREFARSGSLGGFFRALNEASLDLQETARGADAVFDAVAGMDAA